MELKDYYLAVKEFSKATKIEEQVIETFVKAQVNKMLKVGDSIDYSKTEFVKTPKKKGRKKK